MCSGSALRAGAERNRQEVSVQARKREWLEHAKRVKVWTAGRRTNCQTRSSYDPSLLSSGDSSHTHAFSVAQGLIKKFLSRRTRICLILVG